ncbi:hypothetical protein ALC57_12892 [Trachymyrmex cornetzi]|uniref:Uncharacterized protein n=1 Tax=Trachymyrmex cornetzi TaxID=471704 RepID=A0A151J0C1_9HYME|nr:hypothetical protein ALC57_12892 [Trachymyrmex cornetzi]
MAPSYVPLRVKQLLSETFLSTGFSFQDIWLDHLKWDTLYTLRNKIFHRNFANAHNSVNFHRIKTIFFFIL